MADITISYKGNTIAEVSASGTTTLGTSGKYCEDDISIAYTKPSGSYIGGTVAWNQLLSLTSKTVNDVSVSVSNGKISYSGTASSSGGRTNFISDTDFNVVSGHKYFCSVIGDTNSNLRYYVTSKSSSSVIPIAYFTASVIREATATALCGIGANFSQNVDYSGISCYVNLFDLTSMFGSAIADYIYSLEQGTAGAGIAWLKANGFFSKPYYPYATASLQSVELFVPPIKDSNGKIIGYFPQNFNFELRGILKLDSNNNLYYDGDEYDGNGTVTRKCGFRAYESGDATDGSTMITDGSNTVYLLSIPTTESV